MASSGGKLITLRNIKRALEIGPSKSTNYVINGRIINFRPYKSFNFIDITDGSTNNHIQAIIKRELLSKPELGAYISCQGYLVKSPGTKQDLEFKIDKLNYYGACDPNEYPLAIAPDNDSNRLPIGWYRKYAHLRPRVPYFASLLRVRSELELSLHMIMKQMDFFRVHTPSFTSNDSEASSDLFIVKRSKLNSHLNSNSLQNDDLDQNNSGTDDDGDDTNNNRNEIGSPLLVEKNDSQTANQHHHQQLQQQQQRFVRDDYFKKDVFLVTSAQLHLESLAASLSRVYTLSAAFRAENSLSTRHLCEFLMFEAEEANVIELGPLMDRVESIVKFIAHYLGEVSEHKSDFLSLVEKNSNADIYGRLTSKPYIRMNYKEALEILREKTDFSGNTHYGSDIGRVQERMLLDYCDNVPIFITNYPKYLKPFYMKCDADDKEAQCFDLIAPLGGEICGGSLREDSIEKLEQSLEATKAIHNNNSFNWYLDSRRFGSFPHGGFGLGVERFLQSLLGIKNIRDTTAFPRWAGRCPM